IIQISHLHKSFGSNRVLRNVSLEIPQGAIVGLLGTNGSGKSTLIKCLLGLLKITQGEAKIYGEDVWDLSASSKARLGYVPQEIQLYPWMLGRQIIEYTAAFYPTWDFDLTNKLLGEWQMDPDERVSTLSPGQLQKLALILALGHSPELLIFDEPVASLDPLARREFLKSLLEITQDERHTVLFSTHITSDLERVASHVAVMRNGRIEFFDELDALKDKVKRLRISAAEDLPRDFAITGALRTEVDGPRALVAVSDLQPHMLEEIKTRWQAEVSVEDLNLEDIFLELHQR
ncbi:MAG: ytrB 1, partial [Planctomycetaceae bacterium]|nr:ytrB 1 [Planctomycetaceae bacterium]